MTTLKQWRAYEARYVDGLSPAASMARVGIRTKQAFYALLRRFFANNPGKKIVRGRRRTVGAILISAFDGDEI